MTFVKAKPVQQLTAEEEEDGAVSDKLAIYNIEEIGPATEKRLREAGFRSIREDPAKLISKRIIEEIVGQARMNLFVRK
jgi:nucleotidyltransferase/DNA polymerase involved in DNA repair